MRIIWPIVFVALMSCGRDKEKPKQPPAPAPTPPPTQPSPPTNGGGGSPFPFPIPGFPSIPGIPGFPSPGNPQPPEQPAPEPTNPDTVAQLVIEINRARASRGLSQITVEDKLTCAAQRHANDVGVKRSCSHSGSDGSSPWARASGCGTSADGEIIACGQGTPKQAVDAWTNSPGHAAIMYDRNQSVVGAAMVNNYWVVIWR